MPILREPPVLQSELIRKRISSAALAALRAEAWISPKPGLVDRFDCGAHDDMDLQLFYRSAQTIAPYLGSMAASGFEAGEGSGCSRNRLTEVFAAARKIGQLAETAMFAATGGVNTHKGAIFTIGLLSTAYGYLNGGYAGIRSAMPPEEKVFQCAAGMVAGIVTAELAAHTGHCRTAGGKVYRAYGLSGIRGEAEGGFNSILHFALPALRQARQDGLSLDATVLQVLLSLMTIVEDTYIAARGGVAALHFVQGAARRALSAGGVYTAAGRRLITKMNQEFMKRNLSPGGSADLLAATIFLDKIAQV